MGSNPSGSRPNFFGRQHLTFDKGGKGVGSRRVWQCGCETSRNRFLFSLYAFKCVAFASFVGDSHICFVIIEFIIKP